MNKYQATSNITETHLHSFVISNSTTNDEYQYDNPPNTYK